MFKIAKLEELKNEKVTINPVTQQHNAVVNGKVESETFETLSFEISSEDYSFSFDLNCKMDKLLEIPMSETIDFNDYIFHGETWLNIRGLNGMEADMDIKITRYLENKFVVYLRFTSDSEDYSGAIEFSFDLDEYIK